MAGNKQRGISQVFCHAPVEWNAALAHQTPVLDDALHTAMQREVLGNRRQTIGESLDFLGRNGGITILDVFRRQKGRQSIVIGWV